MSFLTGFFSYAYTVFVEGGGAYQTGDWLINYHGGFVRRGLFGSLFLSIFGNFTFSLWLLFIVQSLMYLIVFAFFIIYLYRRNSSWLVTICICSPAGIAFSGWDIYAFGRKEVIGYLVLILLASRRSLKHIAAVSWLILMSALLLYTIGVFSWEPLALFIPIITILIAKEFNETISRNQRNFVCSLFILVSAVGLLSAMSNKGTKFQVISICKAVRDAGINGTALCSGAIDAIGWSSGFTIGKVHDSFPLYFWYFPLFLIAISPFFYFKLFRHAKSIAFFSFLFLFPLYLVVTDYGRWFSIFFTTFLIYLIATNKLYSNSNHILDSPSFGIPYLCTWGLPHWADPNLTFPIVGAIATPVKLIYRFLLQ